MPAGVPNFSKLTRRQAALESALARWVAARPLAGKLATLVGAPVRVRLVGTGAAWRFDPDAALAEVRIGGLSIVVAAASRPVRAIAQRLLGGPEELAAARPLTTAEHAIWMLLAAAALADAGIAGDVWPAHEAPRESQAVEFVVAIGELAVSVVALCPSELLVKAPPPRAAPAWTFAWPIVVARCALPAAAVTALAIRDIVTVERALALVIGDGSVSLEAAPGAIEARVASGYVRRAMALPDDAHVELTVQLGTSRLSLRQLGDLAVGQVVSLGRPLAGPYEIRAAGRRVGEGELVDVDGELGVRIVSLAQE